MMSHTVDDARSAVESMPDADAPTKQSYRSFKKKFAKLKINFELRMKESESLIREELRIEDLSKRIQEQNDQLLEVLLEFNDSLHVSPNFRYDLSAPGDDAILPTPEREPSPSIHDSASANSALKNAKSGLAAGDVTVESYRELESAVKRANAFPPQKRYSSLTKFPHSAPGPDGSEPFGDTSLEYNLGFLTPEHQTEHYLTTDARLGDDASTLQLSRVPERPSLMEREREIVLRSPVSVHHWLRKHQPNIFLQDNENASEKSASRPTNLRTSRRPNPSRKDEDTHDDDSVMMDSGPTSGGSKGKRKRDEESTPRPKGGSSRSNRKKKDEGTSSTKRPTKRSSGVGA